MVTQGSRWGEHMPKKRIEYSRHREHIDAFLDAEKPIWGDGGAHKARFWG